MLPLQTVAAAASAYITEGNRTHIRQALCYLKKALMENLLVKQTRPLFVSVERKEIFRTHEERLSVRKQKWNTCGEKRSPQTRSSQRKTGFLLKWRSLAAIWVSDGLLNSKLPVWT